MLHIIALLGLLSAATVFHGVDALPLNNHTTSLPHPPRSHVNSNAEVLQARAACGDNCDDHVVSAWSSTASSWAAASTGSHLDVVNTCTPNFQGCAVRVSTAGSDSSWCIPAMQGKAPQSGAKLESLQGSATTFRIEQSGQPENDFIIKLGGIGNNSLILAPSSDGVALCDINDGGNNPSFIISCQSCSNGGSRKRSEPMASGCTFMSKTGGMYVSESSGTVSMQQNSSPSSSSSSGQLFDIVAAEGSRRKQAGHQMNHQTEYVPTQTAEMPCDDCEDAVAMTQVAAPSPLCARDGTDCPYDK